MWKPVMGTSWNYGWVKVNWSSRICLWSWNQDGTCLSMVGTLCIEETRSQNCNCKIHVAKSMHEYGIEIPLTVANVLKKREW